MNMRGEAQPPEVTLSPDPMARARHLLREWPWVAFPLAVLVVVGVVFRHHLAWGDVATWVVALATVAALLAATFAGLVAYDLLKVETARDLKAQEDRRRDAADRRAAEAERDARRTAERRAWASKVAAWFVNYEVSHPPSLVWGAVITNAGDLPVFDVRVFFYWVNRPPGGYPWTTDLRWASTSNILVVPPGQERHCELPATVRNAGEERNDQAFLIGIEFTDANGVRWWRNERGGLEERGGV